MTEEDLLPVVMSENVTQNILGAIVFTNTFEGDEKNPPKLSYKIRLSSRPRNSGGSKLNPFFGDTSWKTDLTFPLFQRVGPREKNDYDGGSPGKGL